MKLQMTRRTCLAAHSQQMAQSLVLLCRKQAPRYTVLLCAVAAYCTLGKKCEINSNIRLLYLGSSNFHSLVDKIENDMENLAAHS